MDAKLARERAVEARDALAQVDMATIVALTDAGDNEATTEAITATIMTLQTARQALNPGQVTRTVVPGNGKARRAESSIRDEALGVLRESPGVWFTGTQLSHEMPPSPVSGKPRSSAAIGNTMTIAAQQETSR
jgi:hypothetical protein